MFSVSLRVRKYGRVQAIIVRHHLREFSRDNGW